MRRKRMRSLWRGVVVVLAAGFACAAYIYLTLPDVRALRTRDPQTTAFIELRSQEAIDKGEPPRRVQRWVKYGRISPNLVRAVLVAEDSAFWTHDGVDLQQLKESVEVNIERMEFARGASTITLQLAKNLYLSPSKNPIRKARELLIARRLEAELSKQRILEIYLNVIEWGNGIYGAEAAARTYFGKSAAELTAQESALMAASIRNPRFFNPGRPTARLRNRQELVLRRMGAATPPPVIADPASAEPAPLPAVVGDVPSVPAGGAPTVLPGEIVPPAKPPGPPGGKPGGPPSHD
jgi:monofunctional biosynthetic peptidoglycan transglycosylase